MINHLIWFVAMFVAILSVGCFQQTLGDNDDEDNIWTVYYWDLRNRGNFVRLLFAFKEVQFTSITDFDTFKEHFAAWDESVLDIELSPKEGEYYHSPLFAPPAIKYNNSNDPETNGKAIYLSQTAAVVSFVSNKLAILPQAGSLQDYQARKIVLDCFDIATECMFSTVILAGGGDYRGYSLENIKEYFDNRFSKWMKLLEYPLLRDGGEYLYYFGNTTEEITFADLAVFNLINGMDEVFPAKYFEKLIGRKHPKLLKLYQNIFNIGSVRRFIRKQEREHMSWFNREKIVTPLRESFVPQFDAAEQDEAQLEPDESDPDQCKKPL